MSTTTEFWDDLKKRYLKLKSGEEAWQNEEGMLHDIIEGIQTEIRPRYEFRLPKGLGGTGVVIEVYDTNLKTSRALKCSRPILGRESLMAEIISSEISRLLESSHPNIISIFFHGEVTVNELRWPYFIMEYIQDACDGLEYFNRGVVDGIGIIELLQQWVEGLIHLHARNTIHGDIKLENLLVAPDGRVKLSDLGSARLLSDDPRKTVITFTKDWAHPELRALGTASTVADPNRTKAEIPRAVLRTAFDLYSLGKNIFRILGKYDPKNERRLTQYRRSYLQLMAARLLDGLNEEKDCTLGLPRVVFQDNQVKYSSADQLREDIQKLTGEYTLHTIVEELDHHFPRSIQISTPGPSSFPDRVASFLELPVIRRLAGVSQLGLIIQIYPTATHSRLSHILGTFCNVARYCDALWNDPINPFFRQVFSAHDVTCVLLTGLCHDLGQYPLAHDLEEADYDTFSHKEFTKRLLSGKIDDPKNPGVLVKTLRSQWNTDPQEIIDIIDADAMDYRYPLKARLLHTLIDSPIDADKIDYLIRDSSTLNVSYGKCIDLERLLRCLTVIVEEKGSRQAFISAGIHEKGKMPAEAVAFARYAMFGAVYWHHASRSAKSMLHRAVWEALSQASPSGDKRKKEYKDFQKELEDALFKDIWNPRTAEELFTDQSKGRLSAVPQLAPSDYQMLAWIHSKTSQQGKKLLELICERKLFKRMFVISAAKDAKLWNKLLNLQKDRAWDVLVEFQNEFQRRFVQMIDTIPDEKRKTTTALDKTLTDDIVGRAQKEILFLVDIPGSREGSGGDLYFLQEARIRGHSDWSFNPLETSVIWSSLSKSLLESVGKVRIFCAHGIEGTAEIAAGEEDIKEALESSYHYVTGRRS